MPPTVSHERLSESLRTLVAEYLRNVRRLEDELEVLLRALEGYSSDPPVRPAAAPEPPPVADRPVSDRAAFCVAWRGRRCFLGNSLPFRFFEAIASRPDRYRPYDELLEEVWGGPRSDPAVRHVAKRLRDRLASAGMTDLAAAIDGRQPGHYALRLDRIGSGPTDFQQKSRRRPTARKDHRRIAR